MGYYKVLEGHYCRDEESLYDYHNDHSYKNINLGFKVYLLDKYSKLWCLIVANFMDNYPIN